MRKGAQQDKEYHSLTELIEDLLPICYGRLNLKTVEIENLTLVEINAMIEGWTQRYYDMQDMFIIFSALPTYQTQCKKPPRYEDFIRGREKKTGFEDMTDQELLAFASDDELYTDSGD